MYVRWMGAFKSNGSLEESLRFELTRETCVACEKLHKYKKGRYESFVKEVHLGLLVNPKGVYKTFNGDCKSYYDASGNLRMSQNPRKAATHIEAWAKPDFTGICLDADVSDFAMKVVSRISKEYDLPVYRLVNGKLRPLI